MNDTHGVKGEGWYGFDLDGTLAVYDKWKGIENIGDPIVPMVKLVKKMHDEGKRVKILTARVSPRSNPETKPNPYGDDYRKDFSENDLSLKTIKRCPWLTKAEWTAADFVRDWCDDNLDFVPEITHEKDHLMLELYDDRVKQVVPNEGLIVDDLLKDAEASRESWRQSYKNAVIEKSEVQGKLIEEMLKKRVFNHVTLMIVLTACNIAAAIVNGWRLFCK